MENFADRLCARMAGKQSLLCAGIDPNMEALPDLVVRQARAETSSDHDFIVKVLVNSYVPGLEAMEPYLACCKVNIAFFEQFGLAGLKAFSEILSASRRSGIPVIADAKRGDIGSTAEAYARAFLSGSNINGTKLNDFEADALTVNPFLGSDTMEVFVKACEKFGKGLFVLVKTSNPHSSWLQDLKPGTQTISEVVASWVEERGQSLIGKCGFSSLGAVVGATYPSQAENLRSRMKKSLFLIPGFGAQGGGANEALAGAADRSFAGAASVINASRGLFSVFSDDLSSLADLQQKLVVRCKNLNQQLNNGLK